MCQWIKQQYNAWIKRKKKQSYCTHGWIDQTDDVANAKLPHALTKLDTRTENAWLFEEKHARPVRLLLQHSCVAEKKGEKGRKQGIK